MIRLSGNWTNEEQITLTSPNLGKWYLVLYGFESYSGLNLEVSYTGIPAPLANFNADVLTGSAPLTVSFTDQSTGSITTWEWDFGDGSISTAQNPPHIYTDPGTYTVDLTVTGPGGSAIETKTGYIEVSHASRAMPWMLLLLFD
ncbi:MAG: PKD domain-containing protein [Desulforhopalus sp.]|nr:PKD domain-containing protein [Desulforhopalus sp.]